MGVQSLPVHKSWVLTCIPLPLHTHTHTHTDFSTQSQCCKTKQKWPVVTGLLPLPCNRPNGVSKQCVESACSESLGSSVCAIPCCVHVLFHKFAGLHKQQARYVNRVHSQVNSHTNTFTIWTPIHWRHLTMAYFKGPVAPLKAEVERIRTLGFMPRHK